MGSKTGSLGRDPVHGAYVAAANAESFIVPCTQRHSNRPTAPLHAGMPAQKKFPQLSTARIAIVVTNNLY